MAKDFDSLFGPLPPTMKRHEDGTIACDREHPVVKAMLKQIQICRESGSSEESIRATIERGIDEGLRRLEGGHDGPNP